MKELSLAVVIPVYNEEACIEKVLENWLDTLEREVVGDYRLLVYDDGSKDDSFEIISQLSEKHEKILPFRHANIGHGPTLLRGYKLGFHLAEWVLQIDSDDEINPKDFGDFWRRKQGFDFLIGQRVRNSPPIRQIITLFSRFVISLLFGRGVRDVNCPFRLMRSNSFEESVGKIPPDTFAPNILISGLATQSRMKIQEVPITHKFRETGHVSIRKFKLLKAAMQSFFQTFRFALFRQF